MVCQAGHLFEVVLRLLERFPPSSAEECLAYARAIPHIQTLLRTSLWIAEETGCPRDYPEYDANGYYPDFQGTFDFPMAYMDRVG